MGRELMKTVGREQVPQALRDLADENAVVAVKASELLSSHSATQRFLVDLGSGHVFVTLLTRRIVRNGQVEWSGTLTGKADSRILLIATTGGAIFGIAQSGDSIFHISQLQGQYHRISFTLQSSLPEDRIMSSAADTIANAPDAPPPPPTPASPAPPADSSTAARDEAPLPPLAECNAPVTVNVLVLYTQAAQRSATKSLALGVDSLALIAVGQANDALDRSGVQHTVALAGVVQVPYSEAGDDSIDMVRITDATTEIGSLARRLRREYSADVVSLWIGEGLPGSCGIGWIVRNPAQEQRKRFHVVAARCATTSYSFVHELSHTFGLTHNREESRDSPGAEPWAYGYVARTRRLSTVEAYRRGCLSDTGQPVACTRILQLSNPHNDGMGIDYAVDPAHAAMSAVTARKTMCLVARWSEQP